MMRLRFARSLSISIAILAGALALPGCRGSAIPGFTVAGGPAEWQPTQFATWVPAPMLQAQWLGGSDLPESGGPALLDTGSPVTVLRPGQGTEIHGMLQGPFPCKVGLLGLLLEDPPVIAGDLLSNRTDLVGIVGADILSHFCLALDYQSDRAALFEDCPEPPKPLSETKSWISVGMALAGGGVLHMSDQSVVEVPATRVLLPLVVEGRAVVAVLDTGASSVVLSPGLAADLLESDQHRPVLSGLSVTTVSGQATGWMTRAASMSLGEANLDSVACLVVDSPSLFSGLQAETGAQVEALLGETFLRSFVVALDQKGKRLFLARYLADSHLDPNEFVFIGLSLEDREQGVTVSTVYPDTDAADQGIEPGDLVTSVDGAAPENASEAAQRILAHPVGETVDLGLRRDSENFTRAVLVQNLLPDYPSSKSKPGGAVPPPQPGLPWWQNQRIGVVGPVEPTRDATGACP